MKKWSMQLLGILFCIGLVPSLSWGSGEAQFSCDNACKYSFDVFGEILKAYNQMQSGQTILTEEEARVLLQKEIEDLRKKDEGLIEDLEVQAFALKVQAFALKYQLFNFSEVRRWFLDNPDRFKNLFYNGFAGIYKDQTNFTPKEIEQFCALPEIKEAFFRDATLQTDILKDPQVQSRLVEIIKVSGVAENEKRLFGTVESKIENQIRSLNQKDTLQRFEMAKKLLKLIVAVNNFSGLDAIEMTFNIAKLEKGLFKNRNQLTVDSSPSILSVVSLLNDMSFKLEQIFNQLRQSDIPSCMQQMWLLVKAYPDEAYITQGNYDANVLCKKIVEQVNQSIKKHDDLLLLAKKYAKVASLRNERLVRVNPYKARIAFGINKPFFFQRRGIRFEFKGVPAQDTRIKREAKDE